MAASLFHISVLTLINDYEDKMSLVSLKLFEQYTGNFEDSCEAVALKEKYLNAAESVVLDYLGYNPVLSSYDEYLSGIGDYKLYLHAHPVANVNFIVINGTPADISLFDIKDSYVFYRCRNSKFPIGVENVHINYEAGYSPEEIPDVIKVSIMRIAALMLQEQGGNIGLTGKAMGENSRTFINYTNYDKFLEPLSDLRVMRFN